MGIVLDIIDTDVSKMSQSNDVKSNSNHKRQLNRCHLKLLT